jgi:hypothetical protein
MAQKCRFSQALRGVGYVVESCVVNSLAVLPQHRERLYFVGLRADLVSTARSATVTDGTAAAAAGAAAAVARQPRWRFAWPAGLEVAERCESGQSFGRRCPCRRLDTSGSPALRQILQPEDELPSDIWLTATQWGKVARAGGTTTTAAAAAAAVEPSHTPSAAAANGAPKRGSLAGGACPVETKAGLPKACCHCCRRLAWIDGAARTLMSSYRRGYEMYSEFVSTLIPPPPPIFASSFEGLACLPFVPLASLR